MVADWPRRRRETWTKIPSLFFLAFLLLPPAFATIVDCSTAPALKANAQMGLVFR